ncbi:MAG: peptidoglycan binding protein CsiV [Gammaproteobacteria bacterium]|nr:peptidoglycan binding protein CsiV [Gammaproteobacteria bacterium]MBU2154572.1 peptidoglycan binding protein CsiV [Gammaproteobacteria bacterium]MBU2256188.1 peptidoglycan binding protein CsiV [Gammaproteobacteria bacterium]MBU2296473.1 peptidoglycan binding protein CsiV [Gammaproteobacteria bacterium]
MRALRTLALLPLILLSLLSSTAVLAESLYQVEVIVFRQAATPISAGQLPPDNWAQDALPVDGSNSRSTALNAEAGKLSPSNGYQVLLHKAWSQNLGGSSSRVAISTGNEQFGHYPVEGTISLKAGRVIELDSDIWVNQLDASGILNDSERIKQSSRLKSSELTFVDNGSLGLLIRVSPL